jgi:hypothetical protein
VSRVESEVKKAPSALRKRCDVIKSERAALKCCVVNKASSRGIWGGESLCVKIRYIEHRIKEGMK